MVLIFIIIALCFNILAILICYSMVGESCNGWKFSPFDFFSIFQNHLRLNPWNGEMKKWKERQEGLSDTYFIFFLITYKKIYLCWKFYYFWNPSQKKPFFSETIINRELRIVANAFNQTGEQDELSVHLRGEVYRLALFLNFRAKSFINWRIESYMVLKNRAKN